jgi:serine phosphatase RsbU (regulator of sigma subunit)
VILFCTEVAVHALAAIYYIGLESGFQFYLLAIVVLAHLGYGWKKSIRWSIFFSFLLLFTLSFIFLRDSLIYELNKTVINSLYIFNVIVFSFLASICLQYYVSLIIVFEKKLKQINVSLNQKNDLINEQKEEIETQRDILFEQKGEIEKTHKEVTDSIDYAKSIQKSLLPISASLNKNIKEHFVFFQPKYKVSGDFYWWADIDSHTIITAADCTGHGVPGAFMSMLGISFLREIVVKEFITQPAVILERLRKEIVKSLKQKGETGEQKDGMDMGMVSINHENNIASFSGANNPVYIVSENNLRIDNANIKEYDCLGNKAKLYEIKPDKMPIGIYQKMDKFTTHEFQLTAGDIIYLFSDGFADQFGGKKGKKFKYNSFKNILLENSDKPMSEQKAILQKTFKSWQENQEQIDDVLVIGIKI